MESINPIEIAIASARIKNYIHRTPIFSSQILNNLLGHQIYFKLEPLQKTGSFKIRGALNTLLKLKENNNLPKEVVAFSSGNHAQAIGYVAQKFSIEALIYMDQTASAYKIDATKKLGAEVALTKTKKETEIYAQQKASEGYLYVHSSNDEEIICGQGVACLDAIEEVGGFDAVFAACGGGGLISGSYLACQNLPIKPKIFACEPLLANDTARSYQSGQIYSFEETPKTIADGARTLRPSLLTFPYIQKLDGVYEISEEEIIKWTQIVSSYLKILI